MDCELLCNSRECHKVLTGHAWVTNCSHIFCNEDGQKHLVEQKKCPACGHLMKGDDFEFIRVNLSPSETYKTMVLVGQKPDVIMDICTRAMNFWVFQSTQESLYKDHMIAKMQEKMIKIEKNCEELTSSVTKENKSITAKLSLMQKEYEALKSSHKELTNSLGEKTRELQKLQMNFKTQTMRHKLAATSSNRPSPKRPAPRPTVASRDDSYVQLKMPFGRPTTSHRTSPARVHNFDIFLENVGKESPEKEDCSILQKLF